MARPTVIPSRREASARDPFGQSLMLFCVYILASRSRRLYTGVTNDLARRVREHREKRVPGFTARYDIVHLVHYECTPNARAAIQREKQIKGWRRSRKLALIAKHNPEFRDLAEGWFGDSE